MIQVGIDLGTTNTSMCVGMRMVEHQDGSVILPSVVAFPPSGTQLVGYSAKRRRAIDPGNTIFSAKRIIGAKWTSSQVAEFKRRYPVFSLTKAEDDTALFETRAGSISPIDVGNRIVSELAKSMKEAPDKCVATGAVPAAFPKEQREATKAALLKAGFKQVNIIDEPTATAVAYMSRRPFKTAAVYDLGGGTFDFSLVKNQQGKLEILAAGGEPFLGGDDVDHSLATFIAEDILRALSIDLKSDPAVFDRLAQECEQAKIRLAYVNEASLDLARVDPALPANKTFVINRDLLSHTAMDLVRKTFVVCDDVLRQAGIKASQVDDVFLSGGGVLIPSVWDGVKEFFAKQPRCEFAPTEVVSVGTSLWQ